jgi:hypothetical protein
LANKVASDGPTIYPAFKTLTSFVISIIPLLILVVIYKAWKKPIYEGSIPVDPGGRITSQVETAPALAIAFLLVPWMIVFKSKTDLLENIIPNFPTNNGLRFLSSSIGSPN